MNQRANKEQLPNQIVDVASWPAHEDYEVFPVGARNKSLRICPENTGFTFCIPKHQYLFKESFKSAKDPEQQRHPDQYWSEIVAYKIGQLMDLDIPRAFVAVNSKTGEPGTINEWFIGYDSQLKERYTPGGDHMQAMIAGYDRVKGRQHNLNSILVFCKALSQQGKLHQDWKEYWGLCLLFDALIGNTDRHQENWGMIWNEQNTSARLAPYFDNGTSLGHELFSNKIKQLMNDSEMLKSYIRRGRHQMKWKINDNDRLPLLGGVSKFCNKYPTVKTTLRERLNWNNDHLKDILNQLTEFKITYPLTAERAEFIYKLTCLRKKQLLNILEG